MPNEACLPECQNCGTPIPKEKERCPNCMLTPKEVERIQYEEENC